MKVNKDSSIPLYQQVKDYLENKITSCEWEVGYQLPTEKELAAQFEVSNITVKRAVHELVNRGLLRRQSGRGTFVTKAEEKNISALVSLRNEAWEHQEYPHQTLSFNKGRAGKEIGNLLDINANAYIYRINRLKLQEGAPVVIEYSFVPASLCSALQISDIENELLYNIFVKKYGVKLGKARVYFSTTLANEHEADLLDISIGEQLFVFERFTVTTDGQTIEYSKLILRQDQSKYFLEIDL